MRIKKELLVTVFLALILLSLKITQESGSPVFDLQSLQHKENIVRSSFMVNVTHSPEYPIDRDRVAVTAILTDNISGVKNVVLSYYCHMVYGWTGMNRLMGKYEWAYIAWYVTTTTQNITMTQVDNRTYIAEILEYSYQTNVVYQVSVFGKNGELIASSDAREYYVVRSLATLIYSEVSGAITFVVYISVALVLFFRTRK